VIRVVCVINELDLGGAERVLVDQINHSQGVEFHVCLLSAARSVLVSRLPADVPVHDLGGASRWDPRPVARLRATLSAVRPAVVHAHLPRSGAAAAFATRGTGRPLVYTEHSVWSAYSRVTRPLSVVAARTATAVVAVSDAVRRSSREHARIPDAKIRTIRNGVALERLPRATPRQVTGRLRVCAVGNLHHVKGYPHLLRALADLGGEAEVTLDVFGAGPERSLLESMVRDLGLTVSVRFRGQHPDPASELADYDAFCLPSLIEGLPIALIEAMGTGLPVIASAVGGVPEVVRPDVNGILVPPGDPVAIAAALRRLAGDPDLGARLGARARETVAEELDIVGTAAAYARLYQELA
jgi:glycosyltransferase involved in cell wall biosynthesis